MKHAVLTVFVAASALLASNAEAKSWTKLNNTCATSISASDGAVPWATGCTNGDGHGNYPILWLNSYNLSNGNNSWTQVNTDGMWVSAAYQSGQTGNNLWIWKVMADGSLYQGQSTSTTNVNWTNILSSSSASTVSVDPVDVRHYAYYTSYTEGSSGYGFLSVYADNGTTSNYGGAGASFSVATDAGRWWAVGETNGVDYELYANSWNSITGCAAAPDVAGGTIAGGPNGTAYAVGCDGDIHYWTGTWASTGFPNSNAVQVSVGHATIGHVWARDANNAVWTYQ